ncbi:DUF7547 family protein [Halorussus caseinilyticus]|uniref:Uncharacterized protein n=1 Tax=Halorussus caseinilyticus TaxID=3034025 RepID=A0ABD5WJ65_9EURY|nr:hypothetical protein [Halorussus sp. DT72]
MRDDRDDRDGEDGRRNPEKLDERVEELETRVRELRDELGRPPEGPLGLPRPPTPREVLSFTGEYAIPTAIAMLEANVRALKALQQVIRLLDPERSVVSEERDRLQSRAADASRLTLDRLESALEDVETTIREGDLPREDEARSILDDARRINREIRDRVESERREADETRERKRDIDRERSSSDSPDAGLDGGTTIELTDESDADGESADDESAEERAEVDVEAELRSIKDELEGRDERGPEVGKADAEDEADEDARADAESDDGDGDADGGAESSEDDADAE